MYKTQARIQYNSQKQDQELPLWIPPKRRSLSLTDNPVTTHYLGISCTE